MTTSPLPIRLAGRILETLREDGTPPGAHLAEQRLADRLKVSRSPVREALRLLAGEGVVEQRPNRGFFVARPAADLPAAAAGEQDAGEAAYQRLVADRLSGALGKRASERALAERYGLPRRALLALLGRAADEGWAERLPGRGWGFPPVIVSAKSYEDAYRYRLIIEPAALLEPGFAADAAVLARLRAGQEALLGGGARRLSRAELFDVTSGFHEGLAGLCGNALLLDGLKRVNRLRRLIEYRLYGDVARLERMAAEHLRIIELVERDEREAAAALMRIHLRRSRDARAGAIGP